MSELTTAVVALLVLGWALVSGLLARHDVTGPLVFVVAGFLLGNPAWGPLPIDVDTSVVHTVAEVTLALVLFADATRVNVGALRHDLAVPGRLLGIGLPLSVVIGAGLAGWLVGPLPWALAGFVGAALAPTDAALSVQVIEDERIPRHLRRALNVESGLNDGIATPIVTFMLAVAAGQLGLTVEDPTYDAMVALREIGGGIVVGAAVGAGVALLLTLAARRGWVAPGGRRLATFATAVGVLALALAIDVNGFIAAFVCGLTFGAVLDERVVDVAQASDLTELAGELLALLVWLVFGAALVPVAFGVLDVRLVAYALVSLTLVRMVPVGLALLGSDLDRPSTLFLAWFGPRGLASVVFAVLALEELGNGSAATERAVAAIALTVLLSVALHGTTAGPGGARYLRREGGAADTGPAPRGRRPSLSRSTEERS